MVFLWFCSGSSVIRSKTPLRASGIRHLGTQTQDGQAVKVVQFEMPHVRVKLKDIVDGMTLSSDQVRGYLDRHTGRVFEITDDDVDAAECDDSELKDWQRETAAIVRQIDEDTSDRFVALPGRFEIDDHGIMRDFVETVKDPVMSARLDESIRGSGAFRRFKDAASRRGLTKEWFAFRDERCLEVARNWCKREGIEAE